MIKIKDYIFNEKDIRYIQEYDFDEYTQISICTKEQQFIDVNNATFEDIEWNYGKDTPKEDKKIDRVSLLDVNTDYKLKDILNEIIDKINKER